ncbi:MAG: OmpH family outer membrane protein [Nitrospinaceae bacterium]
MTMMLRTRCLPVGISLLACAMATLLAPPVSAQGPRVGFVDLQKALFATNEFKRAKAGFDRDFQKEQKSIQQREKRVKKLFEELNKQSFVLSPELKKQKEEKFIREKKALERYVQDKNEAFGRREKEATQRIRKRMLDLMKTIGKARKFTLIIEKGATFYFNDALDITKQVVAAYNKDHK